MCQIIVAYRKYETNTGPEYLFSVLLISKTIIVPEKAVKACKSVKEKYLGCKCYELELQPRNPMNSPVILPVNRMIDCPSDGPRHKYISFTLTYDEEEQTDFHI